jgi:hypothetical protein
MAFAHNADADALSVSQLGGRGFDGQPEPVRKIRGKRADALKRPRAEADHHGQHWRREASERCGARRCITG